MNIFFQALWFLLPAALANMAPVLVKKYFKILKCPLDFNRKFFDGERILGDHKTFRGLIFGIIFSIVVVILQKALFNIAFFKTLSVIDYSLVNPVGLGIVIGFSVLFGDAVGSFFKRRFQIKPGRMFFPMDQIDSGLFLMLFVAPIYSIGFWFSVLTVGFWFLGHLLINYIGWLLKIKRSKF